jgi:acetyl-CoA C-acetyltransferase
MERVVVVSACRTPVGRFLGKLSPLRAPQLGAAVIAEVVRRAGIRPSLVDEVIMGNVIGAGVGQSPARQALLLAGLPVSTAALTVNMVCASGMKAVALAAQAIVSSIFGRPTYVFPDPLPFRPCTCSCRGTGRRSGLRAYG